MEIRPYRGKYPSVTRLLYKQGYLTRYPRQVERDDLEYDEGIDIVYDFKNLSPAKFEELADQILLAALLEAERYEDEKYKFAKIDVKLNRTEKGKRKAGAIRTYTAAKHWDADVMVYGEEALGYTLPEEEKRRPYLVNKVKDILGIPDSPSPGAYVKKQKPYTVTSLVISIRAGMHERL